MSDAGGKPGLEVEIKLRLEDAEDGLRRLAEAGFVIARARTFESNTVYDTAAGELRRSDRLLRVRTSGDRVLLTYKGPSIAARHKTREEIETALPEAHTVPLILERLGYRPAFRYEKYRTGFGRAGEPGEAVLDETPIGAFLELEGPPDWIDRTTVLLGFSPADAITATYAALYFDYVRDHPSAPAQMVFPA
ncbi:MAG TPA: class IV adenylate cyclase [Bryobacteraceae bacterium]|nr:class IV adenylate cyclase [Bryobacteraceae bacterium]